MEYEPLLRKRLFEGIVDRIKAQIKSGQLNPGDQLPTERELSEKMSVSRTSVREALRTLEIMGYIEIKAGEGVFVKQVTFDDLLEPIMGALSVDKDLILDLLDVRDIIEVEMTKKAVMNASEEDLWRIENAISNAEAEVQAGGLGLEGDNNFHAAVAQATSNQVFIMILQLISDLLSKGREATLMVPGQPVKTVDDHREIYEAIVARNADAAASLMKAHITKAKKNIARIISE